MVSFFDTNVLVYCTDTTSPKKQARAKDLVVRMTAAGDAVLSTQPAPRRSTPKTSATASGSAR